MSNKQKNALKDESLSFLESKWVRPGLGSQRALLSKSVVEEEGVSEEGWPGGEDSVPGGSSPADGLRGAGPLGV